jgi:hypothetical protein
VGNDTMVSRKQDPLDKFLKNAESALKKSQPKEKPYKHKTPAEHLAEWSKDQTKLVGGTGSFNG